MSTSTAEFSVLLQVLISCQMLMLLLQSCDGFPLPVKLTVVLCLVAVDEAEVPPLFAHHRPLVRLHQGRHLGWLALQLFIWIQRQSHFLNLSLQVGNNVSYVSSTKFLSVLHGNKKFNRFHYCFSCTVFLYVQTSWKNYIQIESAWFGKNVYRMNFIFLSNQNNNKIAWLFSIVRLARPISTVKFNLIIPRSVRWSGGK